MSRSSFDASVFKEVGYGEEIKEETEASVVRGRKTMGTQSMKS